MKKGPKRRKLKRQLRKLRKLGIPPASANGNGAQQAAPLPDAADPGARLVALAQFMAQDRRDVMAAMEANRAEADDLREGIELAIATLSDANEHPYEARLEARKVLGGALIRAGLRVPEEADDARD